MTLGCKGFQLCFYCRRSRVLCLQTWSTRPGLGWWPAPRRQEICATAGRVVNPLPTHWRKGEPGRPFLCKEFLLNMARAVFKIF